MGVCLLMGLDQYVVWGTQAQIYKYLSHIDFEWCWYNVALKH